MIIKSDKGTLLTLADKGDIKFEGFYKEQDIDGVTASGELQISFKGEIKLRSSSSDVELKSRFFSQAFFPDSGLVFKFKNDEMAVLDSAGTFYVKGKPSNVLKDPKSKGPIGTTKIYYASGIADYGVNAGDPLIAAKLKDQYKEFKEANPKEYKTGTFDISDFHALAPIKKVLLTSVNNWPFTNKSVPLNGVLFIPDGTGPFPLFLIAHGNHNNLENSTLGYDYILENLASYGILAASIDVNFLNGNIHGENDARAIVHLQHILQFKKWNAQASHPLEKKVDMSRIMIAGHSRGGEAVTHASYFNTLDELVALPNEPSIPLDGNGARPLGPYHFNLRAVIGLAPTDGQYMPLIDQYEQNILDESFGEKRFLETVSDNYFVMQGSHDADLYHFPGYMTYDRSQAINFVDPTAVAQGFKSLLWIYNANHNYFNTDWGIDGNNQLVTDVMDAGKQREIALVYFGSLAQATLLNRSQFLGLFKDKSNASTWLASQTLISQYQDPERLFLQDFDNISEVRLSPPVKGAVNTVSIGGFRKMFLNEGDVSYLYQSSGGLQLSWTISGQHYEITSTNIAALLSSFQFLALRVGQSPTADNTVGKVQDFNILISDDTPTTYTVKASTLQVLPYPDEPYIGGSIPTTLERKTVMQTLRIPFQEIAAKIDIKKMEKIQLKFDVVNKGMVFIDDIQLTK